MQVINHTWPDIVSWLRARIILILGAVGNECALLKPTTQNESNHVYLLTVLPESHAAPGRDSLANLGMGGYHDAAGEPQVGGFSAVEEGEERHRRHKYVDH